MARPKVDTRLQNIEKMEEQIETDVAEIKELIQNSNSKQEEAENQVDCLCDNTKEILENGEKE